MNKINKTEEIRSKIVATQELMNLEDDLNKKKKLLHRLQILQIRKDIEELKQKARELSDKQ